MFRPARFSYLPEVVKNLLIINALFFLAKVVLQSNFGINLDQHLGLHSWQSPDFRPHQFVTHIFMHGNFSHILFNMFALWMFGNQLEKYMGWQTIFDLLHAHGPWGCSIAFGGKSVSNFLARGTNVY